MRRPGVAAAAALGAALLAANAPLAAQAAESEGARPGVTVTVHAGGNAFTRFQDVTLEAAGAPQPEYAADIAASAAASLGADLTVWFRPWLGARLDFLYAPSNFELRLAEDDRSAVLGEESDFAALEYSDLSMFTLTAAGVLALPIPSTHVATYALVGAGATLFRADDRGARGLEQAFEGSAAAFDVAGIAGFGVKIPLRDAAAGRVSLSFELVDRITRTPIAGDGGEVLLEDGDRRVVNRLHVDDIEGDAKYVHSVGIAAGLTFATGGTTPIEGEVDQ